MTTVAIHKYGWSVPKLESLNWIQNEKTGKVSQCMARRHCGAHS